MHENRRIVDAIYKHLFKLFIDHIDIHINTIYIDI